MLEEVVREGARARPGPTRGRRRSSRSKRSRARRATSATGNFAGWAARQMLEHDPNYAGSHYALALVAEHQRRCANRRAERALVQKYWRQADADLPELGIRN